jgi:predicted AlkP superfamily phosphohydrolase/phosphomutase
VINVCGTHPPPKLPGWLISYPMQQSLRASQPEDFLRELSQLGVHIVHDVSVWYSGQARERFLSGVLKADQERCRAALHCWREGTDVLILNLTAIDRVSHFYWQELEQESPILEEESAIFRAYESCDRCLQALVEAAGPETNVLVFSEIGFGPLRAYCSVNTALAAAGFLRWEGPPQLAQVNWSASAAFEAVQGTHGVNINLKGRYWQGTVSVQDYETVRRDVMSALRATLNPHTGLALFARVLPREEVYKGAFVDKAPDILLDPADQRYLPLGDPLWAHKVNRTWQSGWHRAESFWAGQGAAFKPGRRSTSATPLDVAPTIARMLDREPAAEWPGASLTEEP